jgi:dihydroanticapsin dehydrogenase
VDLQLNDRIAVVTGGASGIGRACVEYLVTEGARVAILDRSASGRQVAAELTGQGHIVEFFSCDVAAEPEVSAAMRHVVHTWGGIDALLCCAGISGPVGATATDITVDEWDRVMAVNVRGCFLAAKHALPELTASPIGAVIFVASDAALVAFEGMSPYCSSKGAIVMLAKSLATDFRDVRFNCLCPGVVDTPMSRTDLGLPDGFAGTDVPVIDAAQIAGQAAFLVSPVSHPINATTLVSDFGYVGRSSTPPLQFTR